MKMPLEIRFGKSTSPQFPSAVRLASSLPGYRMEGEGRNISHQVKLEVSLADQAIWAKVERLLHLVGTWRSSSIQVADRPLPYRKLVLAVARVKACHGRKLREGAGEHYCSGKNTPEDEGTFFGCRLCRGVSRRPEEFYFYRQGRSWTKFGTLAPNNDSFRVGKKTILKVLQEEARQGLCVYCPAFSGKRLRADVAELPDVIDLGQDSRFEVGNASTNPTMPLGIRLKAQPDGNDAEAAPTRQVPQIRFEDIAGQDAALEQVRNIVQLPLTHAEFFLALGVQPQSGVILYGPPGNGKTLIAQGLASACQAHFETINGPEVLSKWVGESEANLRRVFERARQLAPSVLLIDELDSLAPRREDMQHHHDVQIISQLLVLLDGLEARGRVAVIATTNRLEALDPAICRPGRFDYHIEVPLPDLQGRAAILRVYLSKMKTAADLPIADLAEHTEGFSGAELAALCRETGLQAILRGIAAGLAASDLAITLPDLEGALAALRHQRVAAGSTCRCAGS